MHLSLGHAFGLFVAAASAGPAPCQSTRHTTPRERYDALVKDYETCTSGGTKSDEQKARDRATLERLPAGFLALAESEPSSDVAVDALTKLVWVEGNTPRVSADAQSPGAQALALLRRDHVASDKLVEGCMRLGGSMRQETEPLLRTVLEKNPHRDVRASACLALAGLLACRQRCVAQMHEIPGLAQRYEELLRGEYLRALQAQDPAAVGREIEALYERAIAEYGDVQLPWFGSVAARAQRDLHERRHLSPGNAAPDTEGEDQHGASFKLGDYRGKVVLLDFWQQH